MSEKLELHISICDDEPPMVQRLRERTEQILGTRYSLHFHTGNTMRELLNEGTACQIAMLDVQLVESSGIELARELLMRNPSCRILFISGYVSSVSQVYTVPHLCFILKDQMDPYFEKFLVMAAEGAAEDASHSLLIQCGRKTECLELGSILYMERSIHQTIIHLSDGSTRISREKISDLLRRMNSASMLRCHVSFAVNLAHVSGMHWGGFTLEDGQTIPISRPNEKSARDAYFHHLSQQT